MKVSVYSAKGGAGKTPIATNIMLHLDLALATNEHFHTYDQFESLVPGESLLVVDLNEPFPEFPDDVDLVFDLAGAISRTAKSIPSAIKQSDVVLIPIFNELNAINSGLRTLEEISKMRGFKGKIAIVATKLTKHHKDPAFLRDCTRWEDYKNIERAVRASPAGDDIPIFPLKFSKAFEAITEQERSIRAIIKKDPLRAFNYGDVAKQFDAIISFLQD